MIPLIPLMPLMPLMPLELLELLLMLLLMLVNVLVVEVPFTVVPPIDTVRLFRPFMVTEPKRQRGQGASPGFALSRQRSQLSTSQIAESLAGGELPLTVSGDNDARDPREFARDSSDGVGEAIFSRPAYLKQQ